jgi:hypothetical protein
MDSSITEWHCWFPKSSSFHHQVIDMESTFSRALIDSLMAAMAAVTMDAASEKGVYRQAAQRTPRTHPKYMPFLSPVLSPLVFGSASMRTTANVR